MASPVRKLLWKTISNPPHSCYIAQAILLLCMWPFPASSMWADATSILVTVVETMAMRLGLHRPELMQDFSRTKRRLSPTEISEAVKTWSVCYIVGQR